MGVLPRRRPNDRLIYALPGGETPTEFKSGDEQQMFVLKNPNKERRGDADAK